MPAENMSERQFAGLIQAIDLVGWKNTDFCRALVKELGVGKWENYYSQVISRKKFLTRKTTDQSTNCFRRVFENNIRTGSSEALQVFEDHFPFDSTVAFKYLEDHEFHTLGQSVARHVYSIFKPESPLTNADVKFDYKHEFVGRLDSGGSIAKYADELIQKVREASKGRHWNGHTLSYVSWDLVETDNVTESHKYLIAFAATDWDTFTKWQGLLGAQMPIKLSEDESPPGGWRQLWVRKPPKELTSVPTTKQVCVGLVVQTSDDHFLIHRRSKGVSNGQDLWGPSASENCSRYLDESDGPQSSVSTAMKLRADTNTLKRGELNNKMQDALAKLDLDEDGYEPSYVNPFHTACRAFAEEISTALNTVDPNSIKLLEVVYFAELGVVHFLMYAELPESREELLKMIRDYPPVDRDLEIEEFKFINLRDSGDIWEKMMNRDIAPESRAALNAALRHVLPREHILPILKIPRH